MDAIMQVVEKHDLVLIEDCAHAYETFTENSSNSAKLVVSQHNLRRDSLLEELRFLKLRQ